MELRRGAHLPFQAIESIGGYTSESVTHGQCDARPTVTFPAIDHHRPLAGTNIYYILLGEQRQMCVKNLPKVVREAGAAGSRTCDQSDALTTTPRHTKTHNQ